MTKLDDQLKGSLEITESDLPPLPTNSDHTLVAKLAEACNAVGGVSKGGRNTMQNYDYVKAADVAKAIRHELFSRGIVIIPNETKCDFISFETKSGGTMTECRLLVQYFVTNGAESLTFDAWGVARDSGDKAIYKAKTGALKYFLRGLGLIPDEVDDPENDGDDKRPEIAKRKIAEFKGSAAPGPSASAAPKAGASASVGVPASQATTQDVTKYDKLNYADTYQESPDLKQCQFRVARLFRTETIAVKGKPNSGGKPYLRVEYGRVGEWHDSLCSYSQTINNKLLDECKPGDTLDVEFHRSAAGARILDKILSLRHEAENENQDAEPPTGDLGEKLPF